MIVPLQIARPDSAQNFMNTAKKMDLTRLCIEINNTVFFPILHTSNFKKHVNNKPEVLINTMFRILLFRTTDSHRRTERLAQ